MCFFRAGCAGRCGNSIKDELALFYYLNSKSKPLLPKDYLSKTIVEFEKADELKDIDWWLYVFRESNDKLLDILKEYKGKLEKDVIAKACSYLAKNIQNEDGLNNFFAFLRDVVEKGNLKGILERFDELEQLAELICITFFYTMKIANQEMKSNIFANGY